MLLKVGRKFRDFGFLEVKEREEEGRRKLLMVLNLLRREVRGRLKNIIGCRR